MKLAFVTGANGFLGLNLLEQLTTAGWRVVGLCEPGTDLRYIEALGVDIEIGDILDRKTLDRAFPNDVDAVFHTAARTTIWSRQNAIQTRVNVEGTANVLEASTRHGAKRFVHTSTWNTYGLERAEINEETIQTGGKSWVNYVRTKFLGEEEVRKAVDEGLDAVILNPGHLIGRYDTRNWARMIRLVNAGQLPGVPRARGMFCHAEAVARAHIAAVESGMTGENYLLPGVEASFLEVVAIISELLGKPAPSRTLPPPILKLVAHAKTWSASLTGREPTLTPEAVALLMNNPRIASDKAERELGYKPGALREMLEESFNWLRDEGLLS